MNFEVRSAIDNTYNQLSKSFFVFLISLLCLAILPKELYAQAIITANYYFDAVNGSDSNDGRTPTTAWKTASKFNSINFPAGSTIAFRDSMTYKGYFTLTEDGASGNPITVTNWYGSSSGQLPFIEGAGATQLTNWTLVDGYTDVWQSNNSIPSFYSLWFFKGDSVRWGVQYTTLGDLTGEYRLYATGSTLYIYSPTNPATYYDKVLCDYGSDLYGYTASCFTVSGKYCNIENLEMGYTRGKALKFMYGSDYSTADNVTISYCGRAARIDVVAEGGDGFYVESSNVTIRNCTAFENTGHGFYTWGSSQGTISNIVYDGNTAYNNHHTIGFDVNSQTGNIRNVTIKNNFIYSTVRTWWANYFLYNGLHLTGQGSMGNFIKGEVAGLVKKVYFYNNIVMDAIGPSIQVEANSDSVYIYNNTFINLDSAGIHVNGYPQNWSIAGTSNSLDGLHVVNNISVTSVTTPTNYPIRAFHTGELTNNLVYRLDGGTYLVYGYTVPTELRQNPNFVNMYGTSASDFMLQSGSPAINAGATLGAPYNLDMLGNVRSTPPEIGAYEYTDGIGLIDNTPPTLQSAAVINPTTIELSFSEALESISALNKLNYSINNGIVVNSVSLATDGKKVTLSTTTNAANQTYTVVVSNVKDLAGNTISSSNNSVQYSYAGDTTPPNLLSAAVVNPTTIELTFSEALENSSALLKTNYSIDNGIVVNSVSLSTDNKKVTLSTTTNAANQTYTVIVSNVKDVAGNIILSSNNSAQYSYAGDTTPPDLLSAAVLNSTTVKLLFSEPLETTSAQTNTNYSVSNGIVVNTAVLSSDKKSVTLVTSQHTTNQNYTVTVSGVKDIAGNIISLNSSAQYSFLDNTVGNLKADVKIFLQGPYLTNNMITELSGNELIPGTQPYNSAPWLYNGSESSGSSTSTTVDWVLVELRSAQNPAQIISRRAGLLRNDGRIIEPNGSLGVTFNNVLYGSYYIAVHHRNHLSVMTSAPVLFAPDNSLYDFTTSLSKAYGENTMTEITTGVFGMFAGDGDGNGNINVNDRDAVWSLQNGTMGYLNGDLNLDSGVTVKDINDYWNANEGKVTQVP